MAKCCALVKPEQMTGSYELCMLIDGVVKGKGKGLDTKLVCNLVRKVTHARKRNPGRIVTNFCTGVGVHDVITSANFYDFHVREIFAVLDVIRH